MNHSILPPSSAHRTVKCTGWVKLSEGEIEIPSSSAEEGSASHYAGENMLLGSVVMPTMSAPNGVILTNEMIDFAKVYVDDVHSISNHDLNIETTIMVPDVHAKSFGTPDCWYFDKVNLILYIWDYKYGWGIVEAYENWQQINYASGILTILNEKYGISDQDIRINMRIVQPRPWHEDGYVRTWQISGPELRGYVNQLYTQSHTALLDGVPEYTTGDHCRHCPGFLKCPVGTEAMFHMIDLSQKTTSTAKPNIGRMLKLVNMAVKRLKNMKTSLETVASEHMKNGKQIEGFGMKPTFTNKGWDKPVNEILALGKVLGIELGKPQQPITPTQAINKGIPKEMVDLYASSKQSGYKIKEVNLNKVKEMMKNGHS